ncbi:HAD family hydrolase [Streptomyces sp. NPDC020801]|uniref:HAD family hydrolase n=1 Tax=Streptomyces sp. NPDC020801 TaxID=3365093 RepID=UPI003788ADF0
MTEADLVLVLWDIDRTLLYVGDIDRQVYREAFAEVVGRPAERLPARGTGVTMPLAIRGLLLDNGVPERNITELVARIVELLPQRLAGHWADLRSKGVLMPGAINALRAVHDHPHLVPTVVTGNLRANALLKLEAFGLDRFVDTGIGGYASDDAHRPNLVATAQKRAEVKYRTYFSRSNTVIIGDSLEDVRTGREGGSAVVGIPSGKVTAVQLQEAGADVVCNSLEDVRGLIEAVARVTAQFMQP